MTTTTERPARRDLPLRERKKLRTRQALAETALKLFSKKGFDATTLDELVDAVDVSKRTFFRNYTSKEGVALAPEKELWAAYLDELDSRPLSGRLLTIHTNALYAALERMDDDWAPRFLASRRLAKATPALAAHSLQHCSEVTEAAVARLAERLGSRAPDPMRLRLVVELMLAAWHCALHEWSTSKAHPRADDLAAGMRRASAEIASALKLTAG